MPLSSGGMIVLANQDAFRENSQMWAARLYAAYGVGALQVIAQIERQREMSEATIRIIHFTRYEITQIMQHEAQAARARERTMLARLLCWFLYGVSHAD